VPVQWVLGRRVPGAQGLQLLQGLLLAAPGAALQLPLPQVPGQREELEQREPLLL